MNGFSMVRRVNEAICCEDEEDYQNKIRILLGRRKGNAWLLGGALD